MRPFCWAVMLLVGSAQGIQAGKKPLMDNRECKAFCMHNTAELPKGFGSITNQPSNPTVCMAQCDKDYPDLIQVSKPLMDNRECKAFCSHNTAELPKGFGGSTSQPVPPTVCMAQCDR